MPFSLFWPAPLSSSGEVFALYAGQDIGAWFTRQQFYVIALQGFRCSMCGNVAVGSPAHLTYCNVVRNVTPYPA